MFSTGSISLHIASSQLSRNLAFTDQENQKAIFLQTRESKKWRRFDKKFQFYLFLERVETEIVYGHFLCSIWMRRGKSNSFTNISILQFIPDNNMKLQQFYKYYHLFLINLTNQQDIHALTKFFEEHILKPLMSNKLHPENECFFSKCINHGIVLVLVDPKSRMKMCCSFWQY